MLPDRDPYFYTSSYDSPSSPPSLLFSPSLSFTSVLDSPLNSPVMKKDHQPFPLQLAQPQRRPASQTRVPWSSEEDCLLNKGYQQGLSWAMISSSFLPHRSRGCCWGRFKTLQAKALERREWSDPEDRLLLLAVKKHAKMFKHAWKSVAQDLDQHRGWRECESRCIKLGGVIRKKPLHGL